MTVRVLGVAHDVAWIQIASMNSHLTPDFRNVSESTYNRPAISIILPFEPKMSLKSDLAHSLKIASDKIERELKENYPGDTANLVVEKLRSIIANLNFNTHKKSLAIYVSPVFEKVLYLAIAVEEKIVIGESFEIRDLVLSKKQTREYLVLVISGKKSNMFLGKGRQLVKIISNGSSSVHAFVNDPPERVANFSDPSERKEQILNKLLHAIDNSLRLVLNAYHLPLFVLGPEKVMGHFKSLTKSGSAVIEYIHGNYDDAPIEQLKKILEPHIEQWEKVREKDLINQLEDAAGKKQLAIGMRDVWKAATAKKGRMLIVEKDYIFAAQNGGTKNVIYMPATPYNQFSNIKDAVDDVIENVLETGGDVEFVEKDMLIDYHHIALIKYY